MQHTQSLKNQEKVFAARSKETARVKAEDERAAELKQELEREQSRKLIRKAGHDTTIGLREKV